jgi:DNA-binding LytR/AlgR family response regulator
MTYTIGICDDCTEQVDLLAGFLHGCGEYGEFRVIHASEPEAFFETLKTDRPDLVFLDIDMDGMTGIELGEKIRALYENTVLIYITGYEKYAFEAFQLRAFHYLLKPVTLERFRQVLSEALNHIQKEDAGKTEKTFSVANKGELLNLPYRDICYFEKIGHQIKIHALAREVYYYDNLGSLLAGLDGETFVQCHQGYIVNVDKVRAFRGKTLYLDGGVQLPVSRSFAEQVREVLKKHLFAGRGKKP